jgi:hypothetical protein
MVVLYPIRVPFFSGPMRLRIYGYSRKLTKLGQVEASLAEQVES